MSKYTLELRYLYKDGNYDFESLDALDTKLLNEHRDFTISEYEHVHNIQERREKIEQGICPLCGGKLVLRDGKYGEFYGCSNYPKCKFKKNAD